MRGKLDVGVRNATYMSLFWKVPLLHTPFGGAMVARIRVVVVEEQRP
jgi:hypothetical protein